MIYDTSSLIFLSTLSLRRATVHYDNYNLHCTISIHALLAESDGVFNLFANPGSTISIHALLAESDFPIVPAELTTLVFLSTLSLRRATRLQFICKPGQYYFYPRSPCGERRSKKSDHPLPTSNFYPRSPCGERRSKKSDHPLPTSNFYPRSPCGERRHHSVSCQSMQEFLSTLSLRRATGT